MLNNTGRKHRFMFTKDFYYNEITLGRGLNVHLYLVYCMQIYCLRRWPDVLFRVERKEAVKCNAMRHCHTRHVLTSSNKADRYSLDNAD